jgi:hypothetical protein
MKTNAESQGAQNDLRRLCQLWVREHHPQVYRRFQEAIGIKPKAVATSRIASLMEKAMANGDAEEQRKREAIDAEYSHMVEDYPDDNAEGAK